MREQSSKDLLGRFSMFELSLQAGESFTIISKVDNFNVTNLSWIMNQNNLFLILLGFSLLFAQIVIVTVALKKVWENK